MARKALTKNKGISPDFLEKERAALKRDKRKTILFNSRELASIDEYCRLFNVSSKSALIRQAVMERVTSGLDENHPTLF